MIKKFDFDKKYEFITKQDRSTLGEELSLLQQKLYKTKKSVVIMIDGWESVGRGDVLKDLTRELDQRYVNVRTFDYPTDEEKGHTFLWRFMRRLPKYGNIEIYDRSIYYKLIEDLDLSDKQVEEGIATISCFERWLVNDQTLLLKFFLNQKESTMRSRVADGLRSGNVFVNRYDKVQLEHYKDYEKRMDMILKRTNFSYAPWQVVSAEVIKDASKIILEKTIEALRLHLQQEDAFDQPALPPVEKNLFEKLDLTKTLSREEYDKKKELLQMEVGALFEQMHREKKSAVIAFEGTDAAGKGGAIKRLLRYVDPRLMDVSTTAAPDQVEGFHHYLWRFYKEFPLQGRLTVFDRSWYGRVLVERIESFAQVERWEQAYQEIREMEEKLVKEDVFVLKFLVLIDEEEQRKRFEARSKDQKKQYKLTDEDWRNRNRFGEYETAMNDMVQRTHTPEAPWIIVEGNDKLYARIKVLETTLERLKKYLKK